MTITSPQTYAETIMKTFGYWPSNKNTASFIKDGYVQATVILDEGMPVDDFVQQVIHVSNTLESQQLILCHYAESDTIDTSQTEWLKLANAQISNGSDAEVIEALLMSRTRVKSIGCTLPECCPVDGTPVDFTHMKSSKVLEEEYKVRPIDKHEAASMVHNMFTHFDYAVDSYVAEGEVNRHDMWMILTHIQDCVLRDLLLDYILDDESSLGKVTQYSERQAVDAMTWMALRAPGLLRPRALGMASALHAATDDLTLAARILAEQAENDSLAVRMLTAVYQAIPPWEIRKKITGPLGKVRDDLFLRVECGLSAANTSPLNKTP